MSETTQPALTTTLGADPAVLGAAIVDAMSEFVALFDGDMRIVGANRAFCEAMDSPVEDLLGRSAVDLVAPVHQDRAGMILGIAQAQGTMSGVAPFDLVRHDGSILTIQVSGTDLRIGDDQVLVVIGRPAYDMMAMGKVLDRLLVNESLEHVLEPLLDLFAWRLAGSGVAITWSLDGVRSSVSTSLPDALTGMGDRSPDGPWARALRSGEAVHGTVQDVLDPEACAVAQRRGLAEIWVEPIATTSTTPDATITVLTADHGYSPFIHRFGVDETRRYLAVVLRWQDNLRRLNDAAHRDDLTGLANRRGFFDVLAASRGGGSILFADLDRFKEVNDRWGHHVGDLALKEISHRLVDVVDPTVSVARIGGDEFAMILPGASADDAATTAERLRRACAEPFEVDGETVSLGISVGVAHHPTDITEASLPDADRNQYADKRRRRTDR